MSTSNNFNLTVQSFREISLVASAVSVLKFQSYFEFDSDCYDEKSMLQVQTLCIPKTLKPALAKTVYYLYVELKNWVNYINEMFKIEKVSEENLMKCVYHTQWTTHGKIDEKKTAQVLSRLTDLSITERFQFAVVFCIEDSLELLWPKLPPNLHYNTSQYYKSTTMCHVYASFFKLNNPVTPYDLCVTAAQQFNHSAVSYFWPMISQDQKNNFLVLQCNQLAHQFFISHPHRGVDIIYFLLKHTNDNQLELILSNTNRYELLTSLLRDKVYYIFFKSLLNRILGTLTYFEFVYYLHTLCVSYFHSKIINEWFTELWENAPIDYKQLVLSDKNLICEILMHLSVAEDFYNIQQILDGFADKGVILTSTFIHVIKHKYDCFLRWSFFHSLMMKLASNQELITFKKTCIENRFLICDRIVQSTLLDSYYYSRYENSSLIIDKFLNFIYDNEVDINNFKRDFKIPIFT